MVKKIKKFFFDKNVEFFEFKKFLDNRGYLKKIFEKQNLDINIQEIYISNSKKNVFRGLHYTTSKNNINYYLCVKGELVHYFYDTRKNSKTYGRLKTYQNNNKNILIKVKSGIAHGVLSKQNDSFLICLGNSQYDIKHEKIILYTTAKIKLPRNVIISKKDLGNS